MSEADPPLRAGTFGTGAIRLVPVAAQVLRWTPTVFWTATPSELIASLAPPGDDATPLTRAEIARLIESEIHG